VVVEKQTSRSRDARRAQVWRGTDAAVHDWTDADDVTADQTPAWDGAGPGTHIVVLATLAQTNATYYCDVGFGDGPKRPLRLDDEAASCAACDGDHRYEIRRARHAARLEVVFRESKGAAGLNGIRSAPGTMEPRILFDRMVDRPASAFEPGLRRVQVDPTLIFKLVLVVVRHSKTHKYTLMGTRLRVTPHHLEHVDDDDDGRSGNGGDAAAASDDRTLDSAEALLEVLGEAFGMRRLLDDPKERAIVLPSVELAVQVSAARRKKTEGEDDVPRE